MTDISHIENIVTLSDLEGADFSGNPCCKIARYRDLVIAASSDALCFLDGIRIQRHQHIAIRGLQAHRRKIGVVMPQRKSFEDGVEEAPIDYDDIPEMQIENDNNYNMFEASPEV